MKSGRHHPFQRCDGYSRRDVLNMGVLTALGFGLADLLNLKRGHAKAVDRGTAKRCVLIWLDGGPSHLETFDVKPEAPVEVRGPLEAIETRIPGIRIGECMPRTAQMLDKVSIVRSVTSPLGEHNFGTHYLMTGYRPTPVLEYPSFTAVAVHKHLHESVLPKSIAVPNFRVGGSNFSGRGFLPPATQPFEVGSDPAKPDFKVKDLSLAQGMSVSRLHRRQRYVQELDSFSKLGPTDPNLEQAIQLLSSSEARRAFLLEEEPQSVRDRYGRRTVGQSCLLARRLLERNVPFVTVNHRGWDTHNDLYTRLKEGYTGAKTPVGLVPTLDQALSALISDLTERGMFEETLIVVMGEFGRTPKLNVNGGRDHWPRAFSVLFAGGGVPGGQVIGSTDSIAESPLDRPVTPSDLVATIYQLLGISPAEELPTADGRMIRLTPTDAEVIRELAG